MYQRIVVGTDFSTTAAIAVSKASELARLNGAVLHLVTAYREPAGSLLAATASAGVAPADWQPSRHQELESSLDAAAAQLRSGGITVDTHIELGDPADVLIATAGRVGADIIVVGDRGLKGIRGMLGSVPNSVTHRAPYDVLVVHTT